MAEDVTFVFPPIRFMQRFSQFLGGVFSRKKFSIDIGHLRHRLDVLLDVTEVLRASSNGPDSLWMGLRGGT